MSKGWADTYNAIAALTQELLRKNAFAFSRSQPQVQGRYIDSLKDDLIAATWHAAQRINTTYIRGRDEDTVFRTHTKEGLKTGNVCVHGPLHPGTMLTQQSLDPVVVSGRSGVVIAVRHDDIDVLWAPSTCRRKCDD